MKKKLQFLFSMVTMMLVAFTAKAQVYIETDLTSSFNSVATTQWTGSSGQVGWAAPQVKTNSGLTVAAWESYAGTCTNTGTVMKTTVSGLLPGTYKIELYGAAAFTFGRGFGSTAFTGDLSKDTSEGYQPNQSISSETGVSLYAKTSEGTVEQEIPIWYATDFNSSGISTATLDNVVVGANGEVEIGMNKTSTSTNWHVVQLKGVTATVDADAALATAVANAEAVDTSILPASLATEIAAAISTYKDQTYENPEDYIAAIDVLNGLCSKATVYPACKGYLDAMEAQLSNTNVYTEDAYATYYGNVLASYEAGTLDPDAAAEYTVSNAWNTGWHAANKLDDILLSAWTVGGTQAKDYDAAIYINTWSIEGDNDGSNFKAPFFEYWTGDGNSLGANTLTATIEGLAPNSTYAAKAWIRVRAKNGYTAPAYGITMDVNGGEAVDVAAGEQVGTSQFYIAEFMAVGQTDVDGILHININVAADNNISWLSFKDVMYLTADEYEAYEKQAAYEAATKAIVDGNFYKISTTVGETTYYLTTAAGNATFTADAEAATAFKFTAEKNADGALYEIGWNLGYRFTNPNMDGGGEGTPKKEGYIRSDSKNDRPTWERQVFFMKDGVYAVRATNANSTTWGANTYWTVADETAELPLAGYGIEDYRWTLTDVTREATIAEAKAIVEAKAGVGEGLFYIAEADYDTFKGAVEAAVAVLEDAEATPEAKAEAYANLTAAMDAYAAVEVTKPAADAQYTFQLKDGGMYMTLNDGTKLAEEATPLSFVAVAGGYAITNGTEYVAFTGTGSNSWSMNAATEPYAWVITPVGEGYYTIAKATATGQLVGVDNTTAGSSCYANKGAGDKSYWAIAEYVAPAPTYTITLVQPEVGGTISADLEEAEEGAIVTLDFECDDNYGLAAWTVSYIDGEETKYVEVDDETDSFVMPAFNVTVTAVFEEVPVEDDLIPIELSQSPEISDGATRAAVEEGDGYTQYTTDGNVCVIVKMYDVDVEGCDYIQINFAEPIPAGIRAAFWSQSGTDNIELEAGITEYKYVFADDPKCAVQDGVLPQITLLTLWNSQTVKIEGIYKHLADVDVDIPVIGINFDRVAGKGYGADAVEYDEAEILEALGIETWDEIETMYPVVMTTGEAGTDYDGWRNVSGDPEAWNGDGTNLGLCLKYPHDGSMALCTHPGNDPVVGSSLTAGWILGAGDKQVIIEVNVNFIEKPVVAITFDDLNVVETVTSNFEFEVGTCYQAGKATVDVAAILAKLGVESLDDITIYAVQSDKSLDDDYKLNTTDGWRNAAGDWQSWGADAYFYVKADFAAAENQLFEVGTMDPAMNANIKADDVFTAKYAFVKGGDAVVLNAVITMIAPDAINGIALDAEKNVVYDLAGRRVKNVVKGNLYIVNGKKVLVK